MQKKKLYRIKNWSEYNQALINRGSITVWFDEEVIKKWYTQDNAIKKGHPQRYSKIAIECALTIRAIYHLPFRSAQGFLASLIELLHLQLDTPNYTTLCRRQKNLRISLSARKSNEHLHLVIDSSGMKVYGEGEWKVKKHGKSKRRTWRKLHIGINPDNHDIIVAKVTNGNIHDSEPFGAMLQQTDRDIYQTTADGAYDTHNCYQATLNKNSIPNFPPRKNAILHKPTDKAWILRNNAIMLVRRKGLDEWKQETNYHKRSLSETAFFRLKKIFGHHVNAKKFENQITELLLRCNILNKINQLGMPNSYAI
jgi:hypothetical protein